MPETPVPKFRSQIPIPDLPTDRVRAVPFAEVQRYIMVETPADSRVILYRRYMLRIAQRIAWREHARVLVTGDSIGQVASQTLENLTVIAEVRAGLIKAVTDYTNVYTRGCTPPSSTNWKDPDNNVAFHNKTTVLTHNATISIAAKWLDDMNNTALTADQHVAGDRSMKMIEALTLP